MITLMITVSEMVYETCKDLHKGNLADQMEKAIAEGVPVSGDTENKGEWISHYDEDAKEEAIKVLNDYDGYFIGHSSDEVNEALDMAISALKGGWIPTKERLPKMGEAVMCCNEHGSVFTSAITHRGICEKPYFGSHYNVVAWQPLPEPYKKGE